MTLNTSDNVTDNKISQCKVSSEVRHGKGIIITIFVSMIVGFLLRFGGSIEGYLFPVERITNLSIVETVPPLDRVRVEGTLERFRNCTREEIAWYVGRPNNSIRVQIEFEQPTAIETTGNYEFGPWLLHLSEFQLLNNSYAVIYHSCHPLWLTETHYYPN